MKLLYVVMCILLVDLLYLIFGVCYINWCVDILIYSMEKNYIMLYVGLIYDINDNWFVYVSYIFIFQLQNKCDKVG